MPWFQSKPHRGYWGWHWTMGALNPDQVGPDGRRSIATHYYPLIGAYDSADPDVLEYHALLMKIAGIDGVIIDWYGVASLWDYPDIHAASRDLYSALADKGLVFAVCYEDQSLGHLISQGVITQSGAVAQAERDMNALRDLWVAGGSYVMDAGRPLILNFGPQHLYSATEWNQAFSGFSKSPAFLTLNNPVSGATAGTYPWPPMWQSENGVLSTSKLNAYLDGHYASAAGADVRMGSAFPGFHDYYAQAGLHATYGYLDSRNGATMSETLEKAVSSGSEYVQLVTWNDFGEGTTIEPTREYGYQYLEQIQQTVIQLRTLPYHAVDLELPLRIFELRKAGAATDELDLAVAYLSAGDPSSARTVLENLSNLPPTVVAAPGNLVGYRGTPLIVSVRGVFQDQDSPSLSYSVSTSAGLIVSASISGETVTLTPQALGSATITLTADDGEGGTADVNFRVRVLNRAPTVQSALADLALTAGSGETRIDLTPTFSDADGDPLTFTASSSSASVAQVGIDGSVLVTTPLAFGTETVTVTASDGLGGEVSDSFSLDIASGVDTEPEGIPTAFALTEAYPNPFRSSVSVSFDVPVQGRLQIVILDSLGRRIHQLANETHAPGRHTLTWEPVGLPSGAYLAHMQAAGFSETVMLLLVR